MTCLLAEQDLCVPNYIRDCVATGSLIRASTHKRAGNVGIRGNSGRGLGMAETTRMTDTVEKKF